ncbi:Zinc finger C2HC domain-containing protein [Trema orientale]|uniref:Zinc finger C2HC domain-containing protein n=1 Tax=Trema orientale TaxID=63057 RepID=A0A2P5CIV2_TREOI|nr:Zinc finger C2HC domain-containing protein [Trema orientale]
MGTRVPVQHFGMRSATSYIASPLHDLNTVDSRPPAAAADMESISDVDREAVTEDSLDNDDDSNAVVSDCMHESYRSPLQLHSVSGDEDRSSLENNGPSRGPYDILTIEDVSPIESARARFLQIIVDHFIRDHVVEVADSEVDYSGQSSQEKLNKRKAREVQYEGDPRFSLPLMYVANMYETLVNDVNIRLASLNGFRDKTIGVALEAAGGLYRRLAKKFPKKGPCTFKRRELATSLETRTRFPELVIQEEKRVRFVVVNGLDIVEKPNSMPIDAAEWFKRLTGRSEVAVTARDYKFYSPRHKFRRVASSSVSNIPSLTNFPASDNSSVLTTAQGFRTPQTPQQTPCKHHLQPLLHQPQFHPVHHNQPMHQSQHSTQYSQNHQCGPTSHLPEIGHVHHSPTMSQHIACLQPLTGGHVGGRLHVLPSSPAKFCDECGASYLRETSKFCSECGAKRLGM